VEEGRQNRCIDVKFGEKFVKKNSITNFESFFGHEKQQILDMTKKTS